MKQTGIIMSGDHPRLILEGKKTMTRRTWGLEKVNKEPDNWILTAVFQDGKARFCEFDSDQELTIKCPYGGYGDRLWVRENFMVVPSGVVYGTGQFVSIYQEHGAEIDAWLKKYDYGRKFPSIHMPRWASRILLEITEVRAERLQEITALDCLAEGISRNWAGSAQVASDDELRDRYRILWDSLNAKRGFPWGGNWWVWPISFRMVNI